MSARDLERKIAAYNVRKRWAREIIQLQHRLHGRLVVPTHRGMKEGVPQHHLSRLERFNDRDITEDQRQIMREISRRKKALGSQSPIHLDKKDIGRLEKQMVKDREWLRKHMISRRENGLKPSHPDFNDAVSRCEKEHSDQFKTIANRYKNAMRQLEPDDPGAANIEKLRK